MNKRETNMFLAKICENIDRYEDMATHMRQVVLNDLDIGICERNLLSVSYKKACVPYRNTLRLLGDIITKEEARASPQLPILVEYRKKIEGNVTRLCKEILDILIKTLMPGSKDAESKIFY